MIEVTLHQASVGMKRKMFEQSHPELELLFLPGTSQEIGPDFPSPHRPEQPDDIHIVKILSYSRELST